MCACLLKLMLKLLSIAIASIPVCVCFVDWLTDCIRHYLNRKNIPFAIVHDTVVTGVAWTDIQTKHVYVDGDRLAHAPVTFANVIHHETDHVLGRRHEDCRWPGDVMCYVVHSEANGSIIDDQSLYYW